MTDTIQHTKKGDYLIREQNGREAGRYSSLAEAQVALEQRAVTRETDAARREQSYQETQEFNREHADLVQRQIAWQTWRNDNYAELMQEARRVENNARSSANRIAHDSRYFEGESLKCENESRMLAEQSSAYDRACALDARIKTAYRERNAEAWEQALAEAEQMMRGGR
jgi:hypothetical protein